MSQYNDAEFATNGGQAFPCDHRPNWMHPGMTMRDYFAAKATEEDIKEHFFGPITRQIVQDGYGKKREVDAPMKRMREQAKYAYADAMLKARG